MIGYGFSSTVTPVALLWVTNRLLNPALVLVELGVNATLLYREREHIRSTWPRARLMIPGLLPGALVGTVVLAAIAPLTVKILVYALLLPLVGLQLLGWRRPISDERLASPVVGGGIGFLYSLTTISGPPLALFWRNQGLSKDEFRCAMAQVRLAESGFTAALYAAFGLYSSSVLLFTPYLLVPVLAGIPLGILLVRRASRDAFGLAVMAADGVIVAYGLSTILGQAGIVRGSTSLGILAFLLAVVAALSLRSFLRLPSYREGGAGPALLATAPPPAPSPPSE